jgi:carbamoyl-phosphate synthase large subunit
VPEAVARVTVDKWATHSFLKKIGMDTPCSWLPEDLDPSRLVYPVFIKPRFGSASKHTFKVHNERELEFFIAYVEKPVIQEYLDGPVITNDVLCDLKGRVLAVILRQRIEVRWGEVSKGLTVFEPVIADHCIQIAKAMQAIGPITMQCMLKSGRPFFIDINARYGGGAPLGIAAGVPSPQWYLSLAAGREVDPPPLGSYQAGLYISRYDQAFFLSSEEVAHAEDHRL